MGMEIKRMGMGIQTWEWKRHCILYEVIEMGGNWCEKFVFAHLYLKCKSEPISTGSPVLVLLTSN